MGLVENKTRKETGMNLTEKERGDMVVIEKKTGEV